MFCSAAVMISAVTNCGRKLCDDDSVTMQWLLHDSPLCYRCEGVSPRRLPLVGCLTVFTPLAVHC